MGRFLVVGGVVAVVVLFIVVSSLVLLPRMHLTHVGGFRPLAQLVVADDASTVTYPSHIAGSWEAYASPWSVAGAMLTGTVGDMYTRVAAAQNLTACASPCTVQLPRLPVFGWSRPGTWAPTLTALLRQLVVGRSTDPHVMCTVPSAERRATEHANTAYYRRQDGTRGLADVTLYKLYHLDISDRSQLYGFDWGFKHGHNYPFVGRDTIPLDPPFRGVRQRGPPLHFPDHLDSHMLYPPSRDEMFQVQMSEFAGLLGIANTLEDTTRCVFGPAGGSSGSSSGGSGSGGGSGAVPMGSLTSAAFGSLVGTRLPRSGVLFDGRLQRTAWLGFTSWKDVKSARIDWGQVFRIDAGRTDDTVYAFFNVLPECNQRSHRPSRTFCRIADECHGGAICDPEQHMDTSFPGMRPYITSLWQRTFGAPLPQLPVSAREQYLWSSRFVMHVDGYLMFMRAARRLAVQMLVDMGPDLHCPFAQYPFFFRRDFDAFDPNPPRCVAMLLERAFNYWMVGTGARVIMVEPRVEAGDWGPKLNVTAASLQPMFEETAGILSAPYLEELSSVV